MISDTFNICAEEIALSGLEGTPLELLWIRLQDRIHSKVIPDGYKQSIWQRMVKLSSEEKGRIISFYTTPNPVIVNDVFYESHWDSDVITHKQRLYIPPPNSLKMVKDEKLDIWGCCEHYSDRVNVTANITDSSMTCIEAIHKYGDKLVLVACQSYRERKMTGVMTDPSWLRSNLKYYSIVESVGKSRNFGIMRHVLNSSFAVEYNAKAFHLINELKELGFIQLETANYTNEGHLINGTLIRLKMYNDAPTNFYTGNDKLGIVHFLDGLDGKSATRKVLRARYGSEVVDNLVAKGVISRAQVGDRMKYKLVTPVSEIPEDVLSKETETAVDGDSSEDENKDGEDLSRPIRRVSYHRESPLFVQCYKLIHDAGMEGLYLQEVIRSLPISHLLGRRVPVTLENAGLIVSKLEDHHHHQSRKLIRRYKLTASCYLKGGRSKNLNFDTHKPKQPKKRKFPSSPNQSSATTTVSPKPTHSRAPIVRQQQQTPEHTDTLDNSYQSDVAIEEPSQDSDLFDNHDETLSVSEYSDSESSPADNTSVTTLSRLKQERGGIVFPEEEIKELVDLLTARFGAMDTEIKLSYVEPNMLPRRLASTEIYERRRGDLIGYFQQRRVVTDRTGMQVLVTTRDTEEGVKYRLDRRTISRLLSQIQTEGYIHQFQLEVSSEGVTQSDKVYLYYSELLTSARMVSKCEGLLIRLTDKISWAEPAYRGPVNDSSHRLFNPALPKFQKLRALHMYLYLLVYGADIEFDKISELPFSWLNKIHPLPDTSENGPGWINAAVALRCIPFSLFFALNARKKDYSELSEPIKDILSDPMKRHLPKARINFDKLGTREFRLKRRYGSKYREILIQLYEIGVVEIEGTMKGTKRAVELNLNLETVYVYIKPKLTLIDTSRDSHGMRFSYFTNEAREYLPTYVIQLETVADLDYYWLMANMISNSSKIVMDFDRRKKVRKHEEFSLKPERDKSNIRNLDLEGFSAAGFPPSLFSNNNRNWSGVQKPPDPAMCHFNYSCNSLAYRAKNVVAIDPNKTKEKFAVPTPKLLVPQRSFLVKSQRKSRGSIVLKKVARLKTVRHYSSNMTSFIRANYKAPSEAGRMRKPLTRCSHWTQEESKKLLLCYITSVSLMQLLERLVPTMVEIMSVLEESSKDKSTSPIRRHLRSLFKKTAMLHHYCDNSIQDVFTDMKSRDSSEYTFENIYEYTKLKLSDNPTAVLRGEFKENITLLPNSVQELQDNYIIKKLCVPIFKPILLTDEHTCDDDIKLSMLQDMIISTVSMYSECTFENYTAYLMYNKFSPPLLKKVLTTFRQNHVLIRNKAVGMRDMKYKFKFILQNRITEYYPLSCSLEPQLIPYSLSDIPLYSDNPDNSDTLVTTLTEDVMLVSPADFYSLLKHLHCHPNNFRLDIELPYKIRKLGDDPISQFPLSVYERAFRPQKPEPSQNILHSVCEIQDEDKFHCTSTSKYFGFTKTDVVKCSDVVTLAVSDAWSVVEFETRELPPDFCNPGSQINAGDMTWLLYVKLVTEHLHYSQRDVTETEEILRIITEQKVMGAPEIDIIQASLSCRESAFSRESLVQNLVNFRLVVRAGTVEPCLIAREYSEAWTHPLLGLDSIQPSHVTQSNLDQQCITSFRPWIGLISSNLTWNKLILNQLTRSIHCYIVTNTGTSELSILNYYHGLCQLRHLRDILQTLVDSGYIRRVVLEDVKGDTGYRKNTLFSKPKLYTMRQDSDLSNKDPTYIFYEGLPGKDVSGDQLMLQD